MRMHSFAAGVSLLLAALGAAAQVPAGSYSQSCFGVQVDANVLKAQCRAMSGAMVATSLTLPCNGTIDNINGNLTCTGAPAAGVPPGTYIQSCSGAQVAANILKAQCRTMSGAMVATSLTLPCNGKIENINGNLTCAGAPMAAVPHGSYSQSCTGAQMVPSTSVLKAQCRTMSGAMVETSLTLPCNGTIDNINGKLTCTGAPMTAVPPGSYLQSCGNARVAGGVLQANCRRADQVTVAATLKLPCTSGRIDNLNGVLTCVGGSAQ
ncbi:MAG TPA: CVNH domain-containing protein [Usitatibacter sp.]